MRKILLYIICSLFLSSFTQAKVLHFVDGTDNKFEQKLNRNLNLLSSDSLKIYLVNQGYLDAEIKFSSDTISITKNSQYKLGNVFVNSEIVKINQDEYFFTEKTVSKVLDNILTVEQQDGYQFASLQVDSSVIENNLVNLYCSFYKGPQVSLDKIKFDGLSKTDPSLLNKYITIEDSTITPKLLQSIEDDAYAVPFVSFVPPIKQEINQGATTANLILPFKEKNNILFEGGGGYLSEQDLFIWNLSIQFQNMFGRGREISLISQKKDINHQHLTIEYQQPIFLIGNGHLNLSIATRDYRDQFYEFSTDLGLLTNYNKKIQFGIEGRYKTVEQENNLPSYRTGLLSVSVSNQTFSSQIKKKQLFSYNWTIRYGNRKYKSDTANIETSFKSYNESRIEINTKVYTQLIKRLNSVFLVNFQSYQTDENLPPIAELYFVGGSNSIRGFKDEQFISIRNLTFTIEPEIDFGSTSLFLFYDGGSIYNRLSSTLNEYDESIIYRYGYGGGVSLQSVSSLLKISFGWNNNLSIDNPRISIQLKTLL